MSFRSVGRVLPTKGFLIRLRERTRLLRSGVDALKMKRDQLVKESQNLLPDLKRRPDIEKKLEDAYRLLRLAYAAAGPDEMRKAALLTMPLLTEMKIKSVIGVEIPEITMREFGLATSPSLNAVVIATARKLADAIKELIPLVNSEAKFERLAAALADTMRKVNALEKIIIPDHEAAIKYIEEALEEDALEEFLRVKKYRQLKRGE
ncbi:MAG: V-type ATP synthase subunit D [Candidatus Korarchaeota archaeon]|nr:V-type ATP synthase subunit D [Candidatus Korarchaeota archaeon]MCD6244600.1 V-type ATP synthase subunit D [Candidatus Korarchaeota archaeon]